MASAIKIRGLSKVYHIRHNRGQSLKSKFVGLFFKRYRERIEKLKAIDSIDLEIPAGTCMGIVGANGSGKSTLLKLVAGILGPTSGTVEISTGARVGTLISLGVGFNHELTGTENIHLNASLYGFNRQQVEEAYDDIVAFSELEHFIDAPLKNYSSGMFARLGFSIIAHLPMDIMLIDEVLGVGDVGFRKKCLGRMNSFREGGRTILFVSHSPSAVIDFCDSACLLDHGRMVTTGPAAEVLDSYDQQRRTQADSCE